MTAFDELRKVLSDCAGSRTVTLDYELLVRLLGEYSAERHSPTLDEGLNCHVRGYVGTTRQL